jgi:hypothetical protein
MLGQQDAVLPQRVASTDGKSWIFRKLAMQRCAASQASGASGALL